MKLGLKLLILEFYDTKLKCIHEKDFEALGDSIEKYFGNLQNQKSTIEKIQEVLDEWKKSLVS